MSVQQELKAEGMSTSIETREDGTIKAGPGKQQENER